MDKALYYQRHPCVLDFEEFKIEILEEAHFTPYSVHPKGTNMYCNLKAMF